MPLSPVAYLGGAFDPGGWCQLNWPALSNHAPHRAQQ